MNMMNRGRMANPPAPQPRSLWRLRIVSIVLLMVSAVMIATIDDLRRISIYAVAPVPFIMLAGVVSSALYWYRKARLEKAYWTPARVAADIDAEERAIDNTRAVEAAAKFIGAAKTDAELSAAVSRVVARLGVRRRPR